MADAIATAKLSFQSGGGPFGAVIVHQSVVIARGMSLADRSHDPTAHAEISAIRAAASRLQTIDLSDCVAYSSAEPCPMCLAAFYWARIPLIYYGSTIKDTVRYGFEDDFLYHEMCRPHEERRVVMRQFMFDEANRELESIRAILSYNTFLPPEWPR